MNGVRKTMKHKLVKCLGVTSIILLCLTLLCGAWVGTHEGSDTSFHAMFSSICVIIAIISQIISLFKCKYCKNH